MKLADRDGEAGIDLENGNMKLKHLRILWLWWFGTIGCYGLIEGQWKETGHLRDSRRFHTATLLPSGQVLVAGGDNGNGDLSSVEIFDPNTGTYKGTGDLVESRSGHTATLLPSGKVLVAGGYFESYLASAELYDPATGDWEAAGEFATSRYLHTATLLPTGKVLLAGGYNGSSLSSAELYDPITGKWETTESLMTPRRGHTATLLPSGKVLVVGGYDIDYLVSGSGNVLDTVDLASGGGLLYVASTTVGPGVLEPITNVATVEVPASMVDIVPGNNLSAVTTPSGIFSDGFEAGDTALWSATVGEE